MNFSSKEEEKTTKAECEISVDKRDDCCLIKIENIGQEKLVRQILTELTDLRAVIERARDLSNDERPTPDKDSVRWQTLEERHNLTLDRIDEFRKSFDKEKVKPDVLARKLDSIREIQLEQQTTHREIKTRFDPLIESICQINEVLMKINERMKLIHCENNKIQPEIQKKFDELQRDVRCLIDSDNSASSSIKQFNKDSGRQSIEQTTRGNVRLFFSERRSQSR